MSKVVITGGAGFIGSQLGKSLADDGHDVVLLDNMAYGYIDNLVIDGKTFGKFVGLDVRSPELPKHLENADCVFHFAGISALPTNQERPYYAIDVNVGGTANVLDAARLVGVRRVVFASTGAVYENNTKFPQAESDPVSPSLIYAVSKFQAEKLCHSFSELYGMEVVITRYFNVYGPHMDFMRTSPPLMSYLVRELLHGRQPMLHSDGTQRRDCVYVDDVNRLNKLCMTHPRAPGETFNVGSGVDTSVREIFDILAKAMNSNVVATYRSSEHYWDAYPNLFKGRYPLDKQVLEKEVRKYTLADTTKSRELLNWQAEVSIEDGLTRTSHYAMRVSGKR